MHGRRTVLPEFGHHHGTIAMYPFRSDIWRSDAKYMREYVISLVRRISGFEHVYFVCRNEDVPELERLELCNVSIVPLEYDDIWARDIGPTFVSECGETKCICWGFNAWGGIDEGSYFPWDKDAAFAGEFANYMHLKVERADLILEGGAILSDGEGTLFTTKSVLLNKNRNPGKTLDEVDTYLRNKLSLKNIVWLDEGLAADETDGHIDNIMSIIRPHEICIAWTDDRNNPNYERVRNIYRQLKAAYTCTIHKIPLPPMQYMSLAESSGLEKNVDALERNEGDILPASYLNFYYVNGGIILPSFGCEEDLVVLDLFRTFFPEREIVQIPCREPLLGGGGIHCILHEIPDLERRLSSRISEKVEIRESNISRKGMFAKELIKKGEIVYIKGGHIITRDELFSSSVINSYLPISADYYLGAINLDEENDIKLFNNHSCDPNCGMHGEITFIAIKDIQPEEELTIDYAFIDDEDYSFECHCGSPNCRHIVTGRDWKRKELQEKYYQYFAQYLKDKIDALND